jgi:hypothetical protein
VTTLAKHYSAAKDVLEVYPKTLIFLRAMLHNIYRVNQESVESVVAPVCVQALPDDLKADFAAVSDLPDAYY